jgi:hypothetical protein
MVDAVVPPIHADAGAPPASQGRARLAEVALPAGLLLLGRLLPPDRPIPFDLCVWHRLTGHDCLACGLTRSVCHLLRGDAAGSLALHPLGVVVTVMLVALAVRGARRALTRRG